MSRYFFGIELPPRDLRLGLIEASQNKIGTPADQVLLLCLHYDPTTGPYVAVMSWVRLAAALTVAAVARVFLAWAWRRARATARQGPRLASGGRQLRIA